MQKGKVVSWSDRRGYGFIKAEDCDQDIFIHYSEIKGDGFKTLSVDSEVTFDVYETDKGLVARNLQKIL